MKLRLSILAAAVVLMFGCVKENTPEPEKEFVLSALVIPAGFPPMNIPADNAFTSDRWKLGKMLFFDKRLSEDHSVSCASCHQPRFAFADEVSVTPGIKQRLGTRNAPTLANVGYLPYFMREGGVPTLEMQVLVPVSEPHEMGFNIVLLAERLARDTSYLSLANKAYGRTIDPYVITRALACFERSIISGESRYDKYLAGDTGALSSREEEGRQLFFSDKTACYKCHSGFNFTDNRFANNGLYETYPDPGRYRLTGDSADLALFKTPTLRNLGYTAPYMHDGSISSLTEVIRHYNSGGKNHPHKSPEIKPLGLTEYQIGSLEAFLLTLDDPNLVTNVYLR